MADEENAGKEGSSSLVGKLVMTGVVVLVPSILALVAFKMVLVPMLGEAVKEDDGPPIDVIDPNERTMRFKLPEETVLTERDSGGSQMLIYSVDIACDSQATLDLIVREQNRFETLLSTLHRNRTEAELKDPVFQESLLDQAKQKMNVLLKRLAPEEEHMVTNVQHHQFAVLPL